MNHPDQVKWNNKYLQKDLSSKLKPSGWLVQHEDVLRSASPGKALDIACGGGRNSIYLAEIGFEVQAIDISDVAIDWLTNQVNKRQLAITPVRTNLEQFVPPENSYDVIINFNYLQRSLFPSIIKALKPGGLLFFQTMNVDHIDKLGFEIDRNFLLEKGELLQVFSNLEVLAHTEEIVKYSNGKKRGISSFLGRK